MSVINVTTPRKKKDSQRGKIENQIRASFDAGIVGMSERLNELWAFAMRTQNDMQSINVAAGLWLLMGFVRE